jgi:hypothetical protein
LPSEAASSWKAKPKMPTAAGQRPRRSGYGQLAAADHLRESGNAAPDRAPRVERLEDVAEQDAGERKSDPEGDEDEDRGEVPGRRLLALEAGPDEHAERDDADGATDDVDHDRPRDLEEPPAAVALELGLRP